MGILIGGGDEVHGAESAGIDKAHPPIGGFQHDMLVQFGRRIVAARIGGATLWFQPDHHGGVPGPCHHPAGHAQMDQQAIPA